MTRSRDVSKGATRNEFIYTATATQTTFSGNDDNSNSLSYTVGQIDVFMNGARLAPADFTATNGTSVVLDSGAAASDIIQINAFGTFSVTDVLAARTEFDYTATAGQTTFSGNDNDSQSLTYTAGRIDVYLNGSRLNVTDDYVATNGTSVVLQSGAAAGDILHVVAYGSFNVANVVATRDLEGNEFILDDDGDTTITADTDDQIDIKIAGADDFKFTANTFHALSGSSVLIGGGSARDVGGNGANVVQIEGTTFANSSMSLTCNANATTAPTLRFAKSRGTSLGSNTVVQQNDELGVIVFAGADGTDVASQGAVIIAAVDGSPGGNDLPTRLQFNVTADGSSSTTARFKIEQNGDLTATDTSIGSISDSRLKENIQDFTYSIDTFKQFEPKTFTWKNPEMHKAGTIRGFTGQDIESVDNYFARTQAIDPKKGGAQGEDNPDYGIIPDNVAKLSKLTEKDAMYISVIKQLIARIEALES